jgi:hypothetical protein
MYVLIRDVTGRTPLIQAQEKPVLLRPFRRREVCSLNDGFKTRDNVRSSQRVNELEVPAGQLIPLTDKQKRNTGQRRDYASITQRANRDEPNEPMDSAESGRCSGRETSYFE